MKVTKLTTNLIVPSIEACLPFYVDRLGFAKTVEVPHEDKLGFVILNLGDIELMLQSTASVASDVPPLATGAHRSVLYFDVDDLAAVKQSLAGIPEVVPQRKTAYGADEIIVEDPAGNVVFFASH